MFPASIYERVFYDTLGMSSAGEVVGLFGEVVSALDLGPADQVVLDFGAGNGMAGERLAALGVGTIVGLDLEPAARDAAARDRPGVYADYLVTNLGAFTATELEALRSRGFTAVLAVAAVGVGHVAPDVLLRALGLLVPGGLFAFPLASVLLPDAADEAAHATGFPAFFAELFSEGGRAERLLSRAYVHRRSTDGTEHRALAVVGRLRA